MNDRDKTQLGKTLWGIADDLRGAMNADDFRDYMLSFLFLRYLSDNYEAAAQKELGRDYPQVEGDGRRVPLAVWYANNPDDVADFEKQMRRKVHYVIKPRTSGPASPIWPARRMESCSTRCKRASNTSRRNPSKAPSRACSPRSIWRRTSSAKNTRSATPSSAPSFKRSPKGWRSFPPTTTRWAMPMNI